MTMVELFKKIDECMTLNINSQKLKTYLSTKNLSEDQKEIIIYILEDKSFTLILDGNKIKAVKKYSEIIKISPNK